MGKCPVVKAKRKIIYYRGVNYAKYIYKIKG